MARVAPAPQSSIINVPEESWGSVFSTVVDNHTTKISGVLLVLYFVIGILFYAIEEEWGVGDVIYFAVVVLTTVGYGDFTPTTDLSKIFTCFYAVFALVIAAFAVSELLEYAAKHAAARAAAIEKKLKKKQNAGGKALDDGIFAMKKSENSRRRKQFLQQLGVFGFLIAVSTLFYGLAKDWDEEDGNVVVNSFYLSVITLTTMGFGDFSATTSLEKVWAVLFMSVGIPVFGGALSSFTSYILGEQKDEVEVKLIRGGMDGEKLDTMKEFSRKFHAGLREATKSYHEDDDEDTIDLVEFMSFVLVENGAVSTSQVQEIIGNFHEMDISNEGKISMQDVKEWQKKHPAHEDEGNGDGANPGAEAEAAGR